jgi:hypothetical protein
MDCLHGLRRPCYHWGPRTVTARVPCPCDVLWTPRAAQLSPSLVLTATLPGSRGDDPATYWHGGQGSRLVYMFILYIVPFWLDSTWWWWWYTECKVALVQNRSILCVHWVLGIRTTYQIHTDLVSFGALVSYCRSRRLAAMHFPEEWWNYKLLSVFKKKGRKRLSCVLMSTSSNWQAEIQAIPWTTQNGDDRRLRQKKNCDVRTDWIGNPGPDQLKREVLVQSTESWMFCSGEEAYRRTRQQQYCGLGDFSPFIQLKHRRTVDALQCQAHTTWIILSKLTLQASSPSLFFL